MSQKVAMKRTETTGMPKNCLEFKDITFSVVKTRIDAALGGGKREMLSISFMAYLAVLSLVTSW